MPDVKIKANASTKMMDVLRVFWTENLGIFPCWSKTTKYKIVVRYKAIYITMSNAINSIGYRVVINHFGIFFA